MTKGEIKIFFRFLKEIGVYKSYLISTNKSKSQKLKGPRNAKQFLYEVKIGNAVQSAFVWSVSPEGHTFWHKVSEQWDIYSGLLNLNDEIIGKINATIYN